MFIREPDKSIITKTNNSNEGKKFKLPISNINIQSRNHNNNLIKDKNIRQYSLFSTKDATPRKEYNNVIMSSSLKNTFYKPSKETSDKNELDDTLSQISQYLNNSRKDLNFSGLIGKFPGISEEQNFVYDLILFNKSSINKAKILSHKIGALKLPISKISSQEALTNSDRSKKCFSDRVQEVVNVNKKNKKDLNDNNVSVSCCFFGKK